MKCPGKGWHGAHVIITLIVNHHRPGHSSALLWCPGCKQAGEPYPCAGELPVLQGTRPGTQDIGTRQGCADPSCHSDTGGALSLRRSQSERGTRGPAISAQGWEDCREQREHVSG